MSSGWEPRVGVEVRTAKFGKAVITRVTHSGIIVKLTEFGDLEVELPQDQLEPMKNMQNQAGLSIQEIASREYFIESELTAGNRLPLRGEPGLRRSVEALRFGLVPDAALEALTVGIEELSNWSKGRFPSAHAGLPQASAISGPFGTGKSHTMAVIRRLAIRAGYVVAKVEVDGRAVSLSAPPKLLHQLWSSTQTAGLLSTTPLLDLYLRAIEAGKRAPTIALAGIDRIKSNYEVVEAIRKAGDIDKLGTLMESLLSSSDEVITSDVSRALRSERKSVYISARPRPMIGSQAGNRPYDFVEVLAGHAVIAQLAGFTGLIVTVDEFEVEQVLTRLQYERVSELLDVLGEYFGGRLNYSPAPLGIFFATVGNDGHEGDEAIASMVGTSDNAHFHLEPWSREQRAELAERIHGVYCDAYGISPIFNCASVDIVERQLSKFGDGDSGLVRSFIKRYVALLDMDYGPPSSQ